VVFTHDRLQRLGESNQIKPNQTGSNLLGGGTRLKDEAARPRRSRAVKPGQTQANPVNRECTRRDANASGDKPVKPNQTESNRIKPNQTC
jgi:hypothetical protein